MSRARAQLAAIAVALAAAGFVAAVAGAAPAAGRGPEAAAAPLPRTPGLRTPSAVPTPRALTAQREGARPALAEPVIDYGVIDTGVPDLPSALRQLGVTLWYRYGLVVPGPGQAVVVRPNTNLEALAASARATPGAAYLIGNEPNLPEQDNLTPEAYADFLARAASTLRRADPAAILVGPNAVNWDYTCTACPGYLSARIWSERFLASYQARYGPLPFNAWGMHVYDLDWTTLPLGHPESSEQQLELTRAWLDARGLALPIWITETGVVWGYEGAEFVDTPEGRLAAPLGLYRTDLLVRWINDLFGWLESHHAALRIERAYLFSTIPVRELWATAPAGIGLFDPTTAALTPMGQAYRARALGSPVPTPAPCAPRPPVQVITRAGGGGRLQVTLASQSGSSGALQALRFGSATNAVIEVGGDASTPGTVSREGNFSLTLPPGTTRVDFFVRQVTSGAATTVPVVAVDGCGDWPTFVGGGPEAFVSSTGTAIPAGPAGVVPTPGPSPTAGTRCTSEPAVQVRTVAGGGALQVVVSGTGDVRLLALRFTSMSNGLVDVGDHRAMASSFSVPLAAGSQQASFVVRRAQPGQATTVSLVVVHSCGEWSTVVGGGPAAF